MDAFLKDLKHSCRMFLKAPGFSIVVIAALALGIGTNTAIFSVVNTVLLKPLAFPDPERIVLFQNLFKQGGRGGTASPNEYNFWRQQTQAFQDVSAYAFNVANLTGDSAPEQIQTTRASANFFRLCGADVIRGRTYTADEDLPKAPKTAVLAYGFWRRRFGSDPQVIGKPITLSGELYEIIGVVGPNLKIEIDQPPDVYVPFQLDPTADDNGHYFTVIGRLKPGVTLAVASAQLQAGYQEYHRTHALPFDFPQIGFGVQPLQEAIVGGVRSLLLILVGAVSFVLLIACANVANLLLARATARKREIAIRAAVGAGRGRIVRQLLTESVLLSLAGGIVGLAAGYAGIRAILSVSPGNIPRIGLEGASVSLDWRVLAFTLGLSIVTGILFGLVPALQSSRADLNSTLKESSNRSGTGLRHNKTRALLVITEMALALVLLIGAALLIRTFVAIRQVNPGFDARGVLTMRMSLTGPQFEKTAGVTQLVHEGVRRISALPGVEVAGFTCCVPLEGGFGLPFEIPGRPAGPASKGGAGWTMVSAGYFETFKIPVLRGRTYREQDDNGPPVVIINQALAKQFWPKGDPLDDRMIIGRGVGPAFQGEQPRQIIGVVGDARDGGLNRDPRPNMYVLPAQITDGENALVSQVIPWAWVIRTRVAPLSLSSAIQRELREASGGLPVATIRTMEETVSRSTASQNFNMLVLTIFGGAALLLAAIGIYGLMAYSVAQRTQEIGIRLALGAGSGSVRNMVVFQALRLAIVGVVIGLAAAFGLTRLIASLLFGVKAWDPIVFCVVPAVLIGVALVSVWLPAIRASLVDPIHALRYE
ncbi:MAG TPA: ABC transporter permease [Bryobacteraceae bacterium]|jgi:putative ABC transport system permease protein|nr:ABC transporter permease [Bryobacteraceae bacterium]